ncbi:MAG TPA: heme-binding domain-containing protein [Melioribacteraceae bacterium]|nr:heme-binding domain-containing protein [Melioribacteraceae bacterium]
MGRILKVFFVMILIALIGIQFIDVERTNPVVTADLKAPVAIKELFIKSCYDCHSNQTEWPWYSYVAPVSWLVANDVAEGRKHLNFSDWEKLPGRKKEELKKEIWEEVRNDKMPMTIYTYTHPEAKLDFTQKNLIKQWATGNGFLN